MSQDPYSTDAIAPPISRDSMPIDPALARVPTFCKVIFIIDLVFCSLRLLVAPLSVLGYVALAEANSPMATSAIFEIIAAVAVGVMGILANSFLLAGKPWAVNFGWLLVVLTLLSYLVPISQLMISAPDPANDAEAVGMVIGGVATALFRIALLVLFIVALTRFQRWLAERRNGGELTSPA